MTGIELRHQARALCHSDLVAALVRLASGVYPLIVRDSVIAELGRRVPKPSPVPTGQDSLFDDLVEDLTGAQGGERR